MTWWTPKPSAAERDQTELEELYRRVSERTIEEAQESRTLLSALTKVIDGSIREPMLKAFDELVQAEQVIGDRPNFQALDFREQLDLKKRLRRIETLDAKLTEEVLSGLFGSLLKELPDAKQPSPFTISLINTLANPREWISRLTASLTDQKYFKREVLSGLRTQLYLNLCRQSGIDPTKPATKPFKHAITSDLPSEELNEVYLRKTPLHALMKTPVSLRFTHEERFNHMHIVGGTGAGKTSLIENLILHDIASNNPPSLVIIDPHGDLIRKLTHADLGIEDRLVIIDPKDIHHPPALNIFAVNQDRLGKYDETTREQVTAGVIQTFDYLFSGLIGAELTAKQGVFFRYVARLMLSLPETMGRNATILDMLKLMEEAPPKSPPGYLPEAYREAISKLPDIPREFFERDFASKTFQQTKEQIRYRLQSILENPTMARLFTSPETKVDLFKEMNRGAIICVDTAKDYLKGASDNFGRIFISLTLQAILERAAIPAADRKDTFLIVDEAASYFDSNIDDLLTEARKYKCGLVLAHQYLDQASHGLRASLAANTGAKFASGLSASDARAMATDMRTTPDYILGQPALQFAAHIRNVTPHAVSIPIVPGALDAEPKLSDEAFETLMATNRRRVSLPRLDTPRSVPSDAEEGPHPALRPDEDVSREW